jgi:hypothetical protein
MDIETSINRHALNANARTLFRAIRMHAGGGTRLAMSVFGIGDPA